MGGTCQNCPIGQVPRPDHLGCRLCKPSEITVNGKCQNCPNLGEVPHGDHKSCVNCPASQFVRNGNCEDCPNSGEVPATDRLHCIFCTSGSVTIVIQFLATDLTVTYIYALNLKKKVLTCSAKI